MATVYVATDLRLERRVAIKVMHHHLSDDERFQERFIQEARAAARLSDPHVVGVFDQGQDDDIAYLVMEYLPGITLRDLLSGGDRLTLEQAITVLDGVLSGLAAAHRSGYIHRDVKPENVLLADDGRIKIGDFGLARATSANTSTGQQLLGTIAYLAPELVTKGTADARVDIYALGIMLYEMLTGVQPYRGEQPMQIAYQHATEQVPRPSIRNPEVPEPLDELVLWATERDPDERPADAREMLERLREIERQIGVFPVAGRARGARAGAEETHDTDPAPRGETKILPPSGATASGETSVLPPSSPIVQTAADDSAAALRSVTRSRRARGWWAALLVIVLAVAAGGTGWWFGSGPGSMVQVPQLAGAASFDDARNALAERELVAVEESAHDLDTPAGQVMSTDPAAGERVDRGTEVIVTVSAGPAAVQIPDLSGETEEHARTILDDAGIVAGADASLAFSSDIDEGSVIGARLLPRQGEPFWCSGGCEAHQGDEMQLLVSAGAVPDVAGLPVGQARETLRDVDLEVADESVTQYSDAVAEGHVIAIADREGGGQWRPGDTVTLIESLGPEPVAVPDVVGMNRDEAVAALRAAGFDVDYSRLWDAFPNRFVVVSGMDPAAGEMRVAAETTVRLFMETTGGV